MRNALAMGTIALMGLGCGRSELPIDDAIFVQDSGAPRNAPGTGVDVPDAVGTTNETPGHDAASGHEPAGDAGPPPDAERVFGNPEGTGDGASALGADGGGAGPSGGPGGCDPSNCMGCCNAKGVCELGVSSLSCGVAGEACHPCDVEKSCSPLGVCQ